MNDQPTVHEAIVAVIGELGAVGKTGVNQDQHYKFRSVEAVVAALQPLLAKHRVHYVPAVEDKVYDERTNKNDKLITTARITVRFRFFGPAGDFVDAVTIGEASDFSDKASNKAMTAAQKYALTQTFNIRTEDMADDDSDRTTIERPARLAQPRPPRPPVDEPAPAGPQDDIRKRIIKLGRERNVFVISDFETKYGVKFGKASQQQLEEYAGLLSGDGVPA